MKRRATNVTRVIDENFADIMEIVMSERDVGARLRNKYGSNVAIKALSGNIFLNCMDKAYRRQELALVKRRKNISGQVVVAKKPRRSKARSDAWRIKKSAYHEYLKSEMWKRKRTEALEFHGSSCMICGSEEDLQVHHTTYDHIFHEYMEDLQILCRGCHVQTHADLKKVKTKQT